MMICYDACVRTFKAESVRRGFTLVELLIVIVVIGILSAMMMISASEVMASARANNIVVALRQWKTATIAWYTEHVDEVNVQGRFSLGYGNNFADKVKAKDIAPYLGGNFEVVNGHPKAYNTQGGIKDSSGLYYFTDHIGSHGPNVWLIGCVMPDNNRLREKLESRAASVGLKWKKNNNIGPYTADSMQGQAQDLSNCIRIEVLDFRNQ